MRPFQSIATRRETQPLKTSGIQNTSKHALTMTAELARVGPQASPHNYREFIIFFNSPTPFAPQTSASTRTSFHSVALGEISDICMPSETLYYAPILSANGKSMMLYWHFRNLQCILAAHKTKIRQCHLIGDKTLYCESLRFGLDGTINGSMLHLFSARVGKPNAFHSPNLVFVDTENLLTRILFSTPWAIRKHVRHPTESPFVTDPTTP